MRDSRDVTGYVTIDCVISQGYNEGPQAPRLLRTVDDARGPRVFETLIFAQVHVFWNLRYMPRVARAAAEIGG